MTGDSLRLHAEDEALIGAVAAAKPRTVVVVMAGSAVTMDYWRHKVPAVLLAWYPGMEGGAALADVLLGAREPGGRLPFVIPRDERDLPPFDKNATTVTYDRWHGQRLLDRDGIAPAYPLGFGLSYTTFTVSEGEARITPGADALAVSATVANVGDRTGGHVIQVYASSAPDAVRKGRILLDFARVELAAGARERVHFQIPLSRLSSRRGPRQWVLDRGTYQIEIGAHAGDPNGVSLPVRV